MEELIEKGKLAKSASRVLGSLSASSKNNALQLKLYQENKMQLNTCHSKFHTSIIDVHTIDEYIYPTSQIENNDRELYLKNSQFNYQKQSTF